MEINFLQVPGATPLEPDELDGLIPGYITTQGQLNEWESLNIEKGLQWAKTARGDILTEKFCKKLHKHMFGDTWQWAGTFRKSDKNIGCSWLQIGIELRTILDTVKYWLENETFPLHEIAIRLHYGLVFVHPFPNGNGRFSRAMADTLIQRYKEIPLAWNNFGDLENTSDMRVKYINSLKKADIGDFEDLVKLCSPIL